MKLHWKSEDGLSLLEVVVATLLLGVGILTAMTLLATGITVNDSNRYKTIAVNLAEDKIEAWKYVALPTTNGTVESVSDYAAAEKNYDIVVTAVPYTIPGSTSTSTTHVFLEVTVSWNDRSFNRTISPSLKNRNLRLGVVRPI